MRGAHAAVSPRPPNPSDTSVPRAEGYTYAAKVPASFLVQGPFSSAAPRPNPSRAIRNFHIDVHRVDG
jgi:hypothetical protein